MRSMQPAPVHRATSTTRHARKSDRMPVGENATGPNGFQVTAKPVAGQGHLTTQPPTWQLNSQRPQHQMQAPRPQAKLYGEAQLHTENLYGGVASLSVL